MTVVVDASAAAGWCFADEASAASDQLLLHVAMNGAVVPALWFFELGNMLRQAERRQRITPDRCRHQFDELSQLPIRIDEDATRKAWLSTTELARHHALTVYDAAYLELALRLQLPLATKDEALLASAQRAGVKITAC